MEFHSSEMIQLSLGFFCVSLFRLKGLLYLFKIKAGRFQI
jgi:hypothetical protein